MKRIGGLVLMAACIGVLSSCSPAVGPSASSHGRDSGISSDFSGGKSGGGSAVSGVADVTAAGVQESLERERNAGFPGPGDFDRTKPGFRLFDPCNSDMLDDLADLGLSPTGDFKRETGLRSCRFLVENDGSTGVHITIESRDLLMDEIRAAFPGGDTKIGTGGHQIYLVEEPLVLDMTCSAYVETVEGTVSISWTEIASPNSGQENCRNAERIIRSIM